MTHFRELLKRGANTSPKEEQDRASNELGLAVATSNLKWWKNRGDCRTPETFLLLIVAPYSQYDLTLLDLIASAAVPPHPVVYVANLLHYDNADQVKTDIPGLEYVHQTPLAAFWEGGVLKKSASGKQAQDLAAEVLELSAEDLSRRVVSEAPKYNSLPSA